MKCDLSNLTDQQKDEIIYQAMTLCCWIGWMHDADKRALAAAEKLKDVIETSLGVELKTYT